MFSKYGWKIEFKRNWEIGEYLIGLNFNRNQEWGEDEPETYFIVYLWKYTLCFGRFHY